MEDLPIPATFFQFPKETLHTTSYDLPFQSCLVVTAVSNTCRNYIRILCRTYSTVSHFHYLKIPLQAEFSCLNMHVVTLTTIPYNRDTLMFAQQSSTLIRGSSTFCSIWPSQKSTVHNIYEKLILLQRKVTWLMCFKLNSYCRDYLQLTGNFIKTYTNYAWQLIRHTSMTHHRAVYRRLLLYWEGCQSFDVLYYLIIQQQVNQSIQGRFQGPTAQKMNYHVYLAVLPLKLSKKNRSEENRNRIAKNAEQNLESQYNQLYKE